MKRKKDIFEYKKWLKPICGFITKHKHRNLIAWTEDFEKRDCKYANRSDFYYKCKICDWVFFNNKPRKEEIEYIKKRIKENKEE